MEISRKHHKKAHNTNSYVGNRMRSELRPCAGSDDVDEMTQRFNINTYLPISTKYGRRYFIIEQSATIKRDVAAPCRLTRTGVLLAVSLR